MAGAGAVAGGGGEYCCVAAYPPPGRSLAYGRQNLHLFRFKNTRFDVIGGAFYFMLVARAPAGSACIAAWPAPRACIAARPAPRACASLGPLSNVHQLSPLYSLCGKASGCR